VGVGNEQSYCGAKGKKVRAHAGGRSSLNRAARRKEKKGEGGGGIMKQKDCGPTFNPLGRGGGGRGLEWKGGEVSSLRRRAEEKG